MALRDWQIALARLVEARAAGRDELAARTAMADLDLDPAERIWLEDVTVTRGFALTSYVAHWWRETRVSYAAPLTLVALGSDAGARLADYQRAVTSFTLFFAPEAMAFLAYVAACEVPGHVRAVARFEHALWDVKRSAAGRRAASAAPAPAPADDAPLVRHPAAALIAFDTDPEPLLAALLCGTALPEPTSEPHHVLVAPGVPGFWRTATRDEARLFLACEPVLTPRQARSLSPCGVAIDALWSARALIPEADVD